MNREELFTTYIDFSDGQFDKFMHAFKHTCGVSLRLKHNQLMSSDGYAVLVTLDQYIKIINASVGGKGVLLKMSPKLMYLQGYV